jgi:ribonuclease HI
VAEYEALVNGMYITTELGVQRLYICGNSEFVVNQVIGESKCHNPCMVAYHQEVRKLEEKFNNFELHHVLRRDNEAAVTHPLSGQNTTVLGDTDYGSQI